MTRFLATFAAGLLVAGVSATTASAQMQQRGYQTQHGQYQSGQRTQRGYDSYGMMRAGPRSSYGNAAMSGNNGNSASGSNSLGHIEGGNIGGGK